MQEKQVTKSKEQTWKEMTDIVTRFSEILFKLNESYSLFSRFDRSLNEACDYKGGAGKPRGFSPWMKATEAITNRNTIWETFVY